MANQTKIRSSMSEFGGKQLQEHMLSHEAPRGVRHNDRRSSSDDTVHGSKQQNGGGAGQSTTEEAANEDDEEDSSGGQDDDKEDEEDDAEVLAPSHGLGKGKGLRPAIHIELAGGDDSHDDEIASHETGRKSSNDSILNLLRNNGNSKKRTFSNLSSTSVLFGDEDAGPLTFPRPKMARKLSRSTGNGLLAYELPSHETDENAIASSDDEDNLDDEDYSGVLEVPDDETDIEGMEQEEEHFIIQEEEQHGNDLFSAAFDLTRRHSVGSYGSDDILSLSMAEPLTFTDLDFAPTDPGFGQFFEADPPLPTSPEPMAKRKFSDSSTKRVRFDDEVQVSDSSSDTSSELDSADFPDLFMEQEKLPLSIYQELIQDDNDSDIADLPSDISEQSYWDVGQDEPRHIASLNPGGFDDDSSDPGSSGYETDMGDTTDEYDSDFGDMPPNPRTPRTKKSVLRRPASAPSSRVPSPSPFQRGNVIPPPRGVFIHDDSRRAIAVTDRFTKTITFYRPRSAGALTGAYSSTNSTANNSPRAAALQLNASDSELSNDMLSNAFMGSDIMFTGLFGNAQSNALMFGGDSIGPPEAFYPFVNIENGNVMSDEDEYDDEDYEDDLNLADFMDFGEDADETDIDQDDETDVPATPATSMAAAHGSTPARPTPYSEPPSSVSRNVSDAMLEHFDRNGVNSFRNNQNRYRDIARLPHDPHVRASVSKPIRSGRSAETLMSPLRKRSTMPRKHRNSPFAGVTKATSRLQSSVMNSRRGPPMGTFS